MPTLLIRCIIAAYVLFFACSAHAQQREILLVSGFKQDGYARFIFTCRQPVGFGAKILGDELWVSFDRGFETNFAAVLKDLREIVSAASISDDGRIIKFKLVSQADRVRRFVSDSFVGVDVISDAISIPISATPSPETIIPKLKPEIDLPEATDPAASIVEKQPSHSETASSFRAKATVSIEKDQEGEAKPGKSNDNEATASTKKVREKIKHTLLFPWEKDVAASVFRRAGNIWAIFNHPSQVDTKAMLGDNADLFMSIEQIDNRHYTILKIKPKKKLYPRVYKEEFDWRIDFNASQDPKVTDPKMLEKFRTPSQAHYLFPKIKHINPVRVFDEDVGDEIVVVPLYKAFTGFFMPRHMIDYKLLRTSQGMAVELFADEVAIQPSKRGLKIQSHLTRLRGKAIQQGKPKKPLISFNVEEVIDESKISTIFPFQEWALGEEHAFKKTERMLLKKIYAAPKEDRISEILTLAKFYLANDMAVEARYFLNMIDNAGKLLHNEMALAKGATYYRLRDYKSALKHFDTLDLERFTPKERREVAFWKAASNLKIRYNLENYNYLEAAVELLKDHAAFLTQEATLAEEKVAEESYASRIVDNSLELIELVSQIDPKFSNSTVVRNLEDMANVVASHSLELLKMITGIRPELSGSAVLRKLKETADLVASQYEREQEEKIEEKEGEELEEVIEEDFGKGFNFFVNRNDFLRKYALPFQQDFALLAVQERIRKKDFQIAERLLEFFSASEQNHSIKNDLDFYWAMVFAHQGRVIEAKEIWRALSNNVFDRFNRARSKYFLATVMHGLGEMDAAHAIKHYDTIRVVWRGDSLELSVLKLLGQLNINEGNFLEGLRVWREIVTNFPNSEVALTIAGKMGKVFTYLFNQGGADDLTALDALTLYYEFRELTPIGKAGDKMIQKLAERLVEVDLLGRAAALLTHQVKFRLKLEERSIVSARLTQIHLMNRRPDLALEVLDSTDGGLMTDRLATQRRHYRIQAYLQQGNYDKASQLLKNDPTEEAKMMRVMVLWGKRKWYQLTQLIEDTLMGRKDTSKELSSTERNLLLRLAVAYALNDNRSALQRTYDSFQHLFDKQSPEWEPFAFLANQEGRVNHQRLKETVALEEIMMFLDAMKLFATDDSKFERITSPG